jgi:prepilin-type N-terminal cleavage/methylation domain-containing protein
VNEYQMTITAQLIKVLKSNINQLRSSQTGFTLVELLIVVSLAVLLMLAASSIFMTFLLGGAKTNIEQNIKSEGEFAMSRMELMLRNAKKLTSACEEGMANISFESFDNLETTFEVADEKIASSSSQLGNYYLTSDENTILDSNSLNFDCYSGDNNAKYINISFALKRGSGDTPDRDTAIVNFERGVTMRN